MKKSENTKLRAAKRIADETRRKSRWLFPIDFDDSRYENCKKFRLTPVTPSTKNKSTKQITINSPIRILIKDSIERIIAHYQKNPGLLDQHPEFKDPKYVRRFAIQQIAEQKREIRAKAKKKTQFANQILKEFESSTFYHQLNAAQQNRISTGIREVVLEFVEQSPFMLTASAGFLEETSREELTDAIYVDTIQVQEGYTLSGAKTGSMFPLRKHDCFTIINEALFWKCRTILGLLWTFGEEGENGAYLKIAKTLVPFTKALNEKLNVYPDLLGPWPTNLPSWPISKSLHPSYDLDHAALLKKLKIGEGLPIRFDEGARWESSIITIWAIHLLEEIDWRRGPKCDDSQLSNDLRRRLSNLASFSETTWLVWWEIAKELLKEQYVDVVNIPELQAWVNSTKPRNKIKEAVWSLATNHHQRPAHQIRKFIHRALKEKFKSLAGMSKF